MKLALKCYIYGAGARGIMLKGKLEKLDFCVIGFIDKDAGKQGSLIAGVPCLPLEVAAKEKGSEIAFISPEQDEGIAEALQPYFSVVFDKKLTNIFLWYCPTNSGYDNFYPIGHYYSLYPAIQDVLSTEDRAIQDASGLNLIPAVNLNTDIQMEMLRKMMDVYPELFDWAQIESTGSSPFRYRYGNPSLSNGDAIGLFSMLRVLSPERVIEVGSGWTSAIMLDVNEHLWNRQKSLTFIEPYADLLKSLIKAEDAINLIEKPVQQVPLSLFEELKNGDVLFIDSTHVSKYGSDVNYLFFEVFPRLSSGVVIHLHDIFYPFEYPHAWIKKGMVWNEDYLLRAFLEYNDSFEILFFQNYLEKNCRDIILKNWPLKNNNIHGGSFWMRKR